MPHTKRNITLLFATLMVTMLLASLSQMIFSSALPTIVGELNGVEHMTWVITAYMLASTITMPIYGKLSDMFGRKPLLLSAIGLFILGSIVGIVAQDMNVLVISRVVQGLGGGGLMILSQAAVADVIPARERGKYMGIMGGVFAFSSIAGPLLGGWLTEGPGWRWAFILNLPLGVAALAAVITLMRLPKVPKPTAKTDFLGMTLLSVLTTAIILTATWGGSTYAWDSIQIISLIATSLVTTLAFIFVERRAAEPVIPMYLFKDLNFVLTTIAGAFIAVAMFGAVGYMPTYFQMAVGASASTAGLLMTPMMIALLGSSVITGALVSKTGKYKLFPVIGSVILALGMGLLSTVETATATYLICIYMAVVGVGLGMSMQILTLIVQNSFPHKLVGTATAANNYFRQVGSSLGTAVVGTLFATRLTDILTDAFSKSTGQTTGMNSLTPELLRNLPDAIRLLIVDAYNSALMPIFIYLVPLGLAAAVILAFVKEKKLATEIQHEIPAESLGEGQVLTTEFDADDKTAKKK